MYDEYILKITTNKQQNTYTHNKITHTYTYIRGEPKDPHPLSSLFLLQESLSSMSWAPGVGTTLGDSLVKGGTHAN